jgi:hypothetical protein
LYNNFADLQGLSVLSTNRCEKVSTNDCENALNVSKEHE